MVLGEGWHPSVRWTSNGKGAEHLRLLESVAVDAPERGFLPELCPKVALAAEVGLSAEPGKPQCHGQAMSCLWPCIGHPQTGAVQRLGISWKDCMLYAACIHGGPFVGFELHWQALENVPDMAVCIKDNHLLV